MVSMLKIAGQAGCGPPLNISPTWLSIARTRVSGTGNPKLMTVFVCDAADKDLTNSRYVCLLYEKKLRGVTRVGV